MNHWSQESIFYHIYPLGLCGTPERNTGGETVPRIRNIINWITWMKSLHVNAVYLGPVFESATHGYDTTDYFSVDRRLGTNADLRETIDALHTVGIRVILDAVFNHTGRDFPAFRELRAGGADSSARSWYAGVDFSRDNSYRDGFSYQTWGGHESLPRLNLAADEVRSHLLAAAEQWIREFNIDGLRLDAADCIDTGFLSELSTRCKALKPDFWLMGEVVHGDYTRWANPATLDSVTNYECYKGLYSSHNDANYFEIAWSLNRQFGPDGMYRNLPLYNFADNHDVARIASTLADAADYYPLHILLFTMPGVPSIYYGSEWAAPGAKRDGSDRELRPHFAAPVDNDHTDAIRRLSAIRLHSRALQRGDYQQLHVDHRLFAFSRTIDGQRATVVVNSADTPARIALPGIAGYDLLNGEPVNTEDGPMLIWPKWGRIIASE